MQQHLNEGCRPYHRPQRRVHSPPRRINMLPARNVPPDPYPTTPKLKIRGVCRTALLPTNASDPSAYPHNTTHLVAASNLLPCRVLAITDIPYWFPLRFEPFFHTTVLPLNGHLNRGAPFFQARIVSASATRRASCRQTRDCRRSVPTVFALARSSVAAGIGRGERDRENRERYRAIYMGYGGRRARP